MAKEREITRHDEWVQDSYTEGDKCLMKLFQSITLRIVFLILMEIKQKHCRYTILDLLKLKVIVLYKLSARKDRLVSMLIENSVIDRKSLYWDLLEIIKNINHF